MRRALIIVVTVCALAVVVPVARNAFGTTSQTSNISFGPDQHLPVLQQPNVLGPQSLEPGIKVDQKGDIYENAIRGVPAGSDLWLMHTADCQKTTDHSCPSFYMGQPEAYQGTSGTSGNSGGGDIDMDPGQPYAFNDCSPGTTTCPGSYGGNLYLASLTLANNTAIVCRDANLSPSSCTVPNSLGTTSADEDREWVAAEGKHIAHISFHNVGPDNITVCTSTNDAQVFQQYSACTQALDPTNPTGTVAALANNQLGNLIVDNSAPVSPTPTTCKLPTPTAPSCHYLYQIYVSVATAQENAAGCPLHTVWMAVSNDSGATFTNHMVYNDKTNLNVGTSTCTAESLNYIFPSVAVDGKGNVYAMWTNGTHVYYESSVDHGTTWNGKTDGTGTPTQIDQHFGTVNCDTTSPTTTCGLNTTLMPWVAASGDGHVDFVWYGSSTNVQAKSGLYGCDNSSTDVPCPSGVHPPAWSVFFAETFNGHANTGTGGSPTAPTIYQTIATHTPNHVGVICVNGLNCPSGPPNPRSLGDFFQVAIEHGATNGLGTRDQYDTQCAVISYANDRNTSLPTQAYFNRQYNACTSAPSPTAAYIANVHSHRASTGTYYNWHASLPATAGFNVDGVKHGTLVRLNRHLIVGRHVTAELMAQFRFFARRAHLKWFYLQRVSADGSKTLYGPYEVGKRYL